VLELKNPHSVLAALKQRPHDVTEIRAGSANLSPPWQEVVDVAGAAGVSVVMRGREPGRGHRQKQAGPKTERVGVASAHVREPIGLKDPTDLFGSVTDASPESPGLWLALDCLQDPHNVGSIFRTAAFFGVRGIVLTRDRSAPLNATVLDVAAGGVEHVPFAVAPNLARSLKAAKEAGLWLLGTSEHASDSVSSITPDRPWLVILGNEEKGLRRLTIEACDLTCAIPPRGPVTSLNVSTAAAVLISRLASD
jgi:23S rRNA (guanosine2251-2'-O)-methyltransferase